MSVISFHRRAERFAQLLDEANGARRHHLRTPDDKELGPLVAISDRARGLRPSTEMDPDFRAGLRAMLVATAEREGIGASANAAEAAARPPALLRLTRPATAAGTRRPASAIARRARARAAVIVGIAAGTLALSGMSAASGDALPGDALYGVKRSTERAQLALAGSDISRGQLYLEFAKTRVSEAHAVREDAHDVADVLDDLDKETKQGVKLLATAAVDRRDPAALDVIDRFVKTQETSLTGLLEAHATGATVRIMQSLALLDAVTGRTETLRETLTCDGEWGSDALGPLPPNNCGTGAPRPDRLPGGLRGD